MRKSHKLLLFFLIASAAAAVAFIQTFNTLAAKNREQVHQELQRFLGKDATFDRLEASLWGGLGFSAKEFRIADDPRFAATPVIRAQELRLGVSLLPLLLGKIVINSLTKASLVFGVLSILTLNLLFGAVAIGLGRYAQRGSSGVDRDIQRRASRGVLTGGVGALLSRVGAAVLIVVYVFGGEG